MKYSIQVCIYMLICASSVSQSNKALGKITYEQISNKKVQYVEMWFSGDTYMYETRFRPEDFLIKGKIYSNIEDSLADVKKNEITMLLLSEPIPQKWIGQINNNIVFNSIFANNKQYTIADTMKFATWEIKPNTITLNGILCQQAETTTPKGVKVIAWFAPSIPVSVAPYSLRGLPGLLVEAKYESDNNSLRMLELEWPIKKNVTFDVPDKASIVTKAELNAVLQKQNKEALELIEYYKKQEKAKEKQQ